MPEQEPETNKEIWFFTSELEGERASSFRQDRWCRIFMEAGAKIVVFNVQGAFHLNEIHCRNEDEFAAFRSESLAKTKPMASVREGIAVRFLRRIKHLLLIDLYLPNIFKLVFRAHTLLKSRNEPVVIMASSPPFSVAVAAYILKILHGDKINLAVDMRDAWALHNALGGIRPIKRWIERAVLRRSNHVTTVSYGLAREFEQAYGVPVGVMYNVATHYLDVPAAPRIDLKEISPEIASERIKFVYTGSTPEGHYDLNSIVGAIALLRMQQPEIADKLQLVFVGACDEVRREAEKQNITHGDIVFTGHVAHATARSIQATADVLLFLAHFGPDNMGVVSTKLFEYLCLGQSVLPLSLHHGSDVDHLLRRYAGKSINVHSAAEIASMLKSVVLEGTSTLPRLAEVHRVKELLDDYRAFARRLLAEKG
jgi:hypothetical protein